MKKLFAGMLVLVLLMTCGVSVCAEGAKDITPYVIYEKADGEITIIRCDSETAEGDFYIPETIEGLPVTKIGISAFSCCYQITSIRLPKSIKSIGAGAFAKCYDLKQIDLGNVEVIGEEAFWACSFKEIHFPATVKKIEIGRSVFFENFSLEKITVDENNPYYYSENNCLIEKESKNLISGCKNSIIPQNITAIANGAFCTFDKEEVIIPSTVKSIGESAFRYCGFKKITIPEGVTEIKPYTFEACEKLETVILPESIKAIGDGAFMACTRLQNINLPQNLESIGGSAFYGCAIKEVNIPKNVKSLDNGVMWAIHYCNDLEIITVDEENPIYYSENNCLIEKETQRLVMACKTSTIPGKVKVIGTTAFSNGDVESIVIPEGVERIEEDVFSGGKNLKNVTIPATVKFIGEGAFDGKNKLNVTYNGTETEWQKIEIEGKRNKNLDKVIFANEETVSPEVTVKPEKMPETEQNYDTIIFLSAIMIVLIIIMFFITSKNKR